MKRIALCRLGVWSTWDQAVHHIVCDSFNDCQIALKRAAKHNLLDFTLCGGGQEEWMSFLCALLGTSCLVIYHVIGLCPSSGTATGSLVSYRFWSELWRAIALFSMGWELKFGNDSSLDLCCSSLFAIQKTASYDLGYPNVLLLVIIVWRNLVCSFSR